MNATLEALPAEQSIGCEAVAARSSFAQQLDPAFSPRAREILSMLNEIFDSLPADGTPAEVAERISFSP